MTEGQPIGLLLAITFAIAVIVLDAVDGSDSLETITAISGPTVSASANTDSDELITSAIGPTLIGQDDSLPNMELPPSSSATGNSDSLEDI